eukprot:3937280-Rhodomonas_salina.1
MPCTIRDLSTAHRVARAKIHWLNTAHPVGRYPSSVPHSAQHARISADSTAQRIALYPISLPDIP